MTPVTAVLCGAGGRGHFAYGPYARKHPEQLRFVAVAEPNDVRRKRFADAHNIPPARQFHSWEQLLAAGKLADSCFNMTQDQDHYQSTLAALNCGYDMLLEKPMTNQLRESVHLVQAAQQQGRLLQICHVLRYTPFFQTLHTILDSGRLGQLISVEHRENVVYWHMAHSFVRGNWRNVASSSPIILAKCCHDLDILFWNAGKAAKLHSFGSLLHFRAVHAPNGATDRCTDGCVVADGCAFDAQKLYLDMQRTSWPITTIANDLSYESRLAALQNGPYGRCVYKCDNDVVDHQIVSIETESSATVTLTMHGHAHRESRTMRYEGSRATLRGRFAHGEDELEIHDHLTGAVENIDIPVAESGHGGGDDGIVRSFIRALRGEEQPLTNARESLESHLMAFAAEESRTQGSVINMAEYRQLAELSTTKE
jgi:predicted dehydrogenase